MAHCKDPKCKVRFVDAARHCQTLQLCRLCDHAGAPRASTLQKPHCVSSRYVLSHYRKCKKACEVCSPVRQAIERHNRRLAAMQKQASESGANPKKRTAPTGQAYSGGVKRQRTGSSQSRGRVRMRAAAGAGVGAGAGAAAPARPASTAPVDTKASVCCTMTREEVRRVACRRFCRRLLVVRPTSALLTPSPSLCLFPLFLPPASVPHPVSAAWLQRRSQPGRDQAQVHPCAQEAHGAGVRQLVL